MIFLDKTYTIRNLQTFLCVIIGLIYFYFCYDSLYERIIVWSDGYALGDWLINYEDGGFKRRGLSGTIFISLSRLSGIYVGKIVFSFVLFLYLTFLILLIRTIRNIKIDFRLILFFLLPTVFFFPLNDFYAFGRKEIIFFNIFILFIDSYYKRDVYSWKFILTLSFIIAFATFLHELTVFYVPYIMLIYLFFYLKEQKGSLFKISIIGASAFIPAFIIFTLGKDINEGNSWVIFKELGVAENVMNGIFDWPKEGFGKGKVNALDFAKVKNYELYIISYLITLSVYIFTLFRKKILELPVYKIIVLHFALVLLSLPLFFLTIDWGRWLNIHFMCLAFILILFYERINPFERISVRSILTHLFSFKYGIKFLIFIILVFGISMHHVELGFKFGQNDFLKAIRDLFWKLRHFNL